MDTVLRLALLAAIVATFHTLGFVVGRDANCGGDQHQRWEARR